MGKSLPTLDLEAQLWRQGLTRVAGVDEVGRGSLAGRVVAAAVIFPPHLDPQLLAGVRDSKQLTPQQREALVPVIRAHALEIGLGSATVREIERLNIRQATILAMRRALGMLDPVDHVLVDGLPVLGGSETALVKGDQRSLSIAAASIIAKVQRDHWMQHLHTFHPHYQWDRNKGYGTPAHRQALENWGSCTHHRRTFLKGIQLSLEFEKRE